MTIVKCWKIFTKIDPDANGVDKAKCNVCEKVFRTGDKNHGTTTLNRRMNRCPKIKFVEDLLKFYYKSFKNIFCRSFDND